VPRIFTFGETVYDIIFKDSKPVEARAGGSMLNTSVSLGRLGLDVNFISDMGMDKIGINISRFLNENGVSTNHIQKYQDRKTAIAIAFLDENNNASYTFYKDYPENRLESLNLEFSEGDIILFGSFFAITHSLRPVLKKYLSLARDKGCIIIYDPNFRKAHVNELPQLEPYILENIKFSDIVRGSDEDFKLIFCARNHMEAFDIVIDNGCKNLIYTANREDVFMMSHDKTVNASVPAILPVSTIGAGDNFNAGLIWTLVNSGITKRSMDILPLEIMQKIVGNGTSFAAEVCMSFDNYISREFASTMKNR
jgi:fructokinase